MYNIKPKLYQQVNIKYLKMIQRLNMLRKALSDGNLVNKKVITIVEGSSS